MSRRLLTVLLPGVLLFTARAEAQCPLDPATPSVTICQPQNGASLASPVRIVAGTRSGTPVTGMWVYVNHKGVYNVSAGQVDVTLTLTPGAYEIIVKAWNSGGQVFEAKVNITVQWSGPPPCPLNSADPSITICTPASNATVSSPVRLQALTNSSKPVTGMYAYVDGTPVYNNSNNQIDTSLTIANGQHKLTVRAWTTQGTVFEKDVLITVGTASQVKVTPASINLGSRAVGRMSSAARVWITNNGTSPVAIRGISLVGDDFSQLENCGMVLPGKRTCEVNVVFKPLVSGTRTATLTIDYDAPGAPVSIPITANGVSTTLPPIPLNHIIFMLQENRSFDHYFGRLNDYRVSLGLPANVDGPPSWAYNNDKAGVKVNRFKMQSMCMEGVTPSWNESHADVNLGNPPVPGGFMDGFVDQAAGFAAFMGFYDTRGVRAMGYYDWNDLPYYYFMATMFATSDRWFSPLSASSAPNRLYLLAGTSIGRAFPPTTTFSNRTIFHLLEERGISWKIYYSDVDSNGVPMSQINSFQPFAQQFRGSKIVPVSQYFDDLKNGTLPAVALIESGYGSGRDEHPGGTVPGKPNTGNHIQVGAAYSATFMNALMQSPFWKDSVFIWTFDEGGGIYDHVPPPFNAAHPDGIKPVDLKPGDVPGDFTRFGFRMPLIVMSPFAKKHYVSHTPADFTAILKLIETRFNLPNLTERDKSQIDMLEFFDFNNPPWMTPPAPPAQSTNGVCDWTLIPR